MPGKRQQRLTAYLEHIKRHDGGIAAIQPTEAAAKSMQAQSMIEAAPALPDTDAALDLAHQGLDTLKQDPAIPLSHPEMDALEAIVLVDERPVFDIQNGDFVADQPGWMQLDDPAVHQRLKQAIPAIGRVDLPGQSRVPYGGTAFLVGPGLLMTNRHVAEIFAAGLGDQGLRFQPGWQAAIDFRHERGSDAVDMLTVRGIKMIHPYWDMALLMVEGDGAQREPLKLSLTDIGDLDGRDVAVIGYPAFDPQRNDVTVQNRLFNNIYRVKRLQPGKLGRRRDIESFQKVVSAGTHDASTLGGDSGSALVDLQTGEVLGLHFGGRYLEANFAVPAFELGRDGHVVDAGVTFAGTPAGGTPPWSDYWQMTEAAPRIDGDAAAPTGAAPAPPPLAAAASALVARNDGSVSITIPLHIAVSLGTPSQLAVTAAQESVAPADDFIEKMVTPEHDDETQPREGYDPGFLGGVAVPMPSAKNPSVIAVLKDGTTTLNYHHFSLQMHAARRIALFTASNVTDEKQLKQPEAGKDYTRAGLSGLGPHDIEKWIDEPRLDGNYQLPDVFFSKDQGAFDKGHIVRREDVAWGTTYDEVRSANGDTYHVTNCSPQVAQYNQSAKGKDNWGDLENLVYANAANEHLCVFAGPILSDADETFVGTAGGGVALRVKIPQAFWKVVVARTQDGIAAYAFVLDQDLSKVPLEMVVTDNFRRLMVSIADLETRTGVVFPQVVRDADQFDDERGRDVAFRGGIEMAAPPGATPQTTETVTPNSGDDEAADD